MFNTNGDSRILVRIEYLIFSENRMLARIKHFLEHEKVATFEHFLEHEKVAII
jgi:hypothetical protein